MRDLLLAARLAWRGVRAGEFRVLLVALLLAVACATLLGVVGERMQGALNQEAARVFGGDLVITGQQPAQDALVAYLNQRQQEDPSLRWSESVRLNTMASHEEELLLVSLNAVDDRYPLLGQVRLASAAGETATEQPPPVGEVWLEPGLALRLNLKLGETLTLGDQQLVFTARLLETPEQSGGFSSLSPKALVHLDTLTGSSLLGRLSRARWRLGLTASTAYLAELKSSLPAQLQTHQRLRLLDEDRPGIARALDEGQRYLGLAGLVAVLLASLAVALASQRQARRQAKEVALLRCLGQSRARVRRLFLLQLVWLGLAAGLVGGLAGYLLHLGLVALLAPLLPLSLPPPSFWPLLTALGLALWLLLGFALAPLLALAQVSPLAVLQARPWSLNPSAKLTYGLAVVAILGLGGWLSGNWLLTLWTLAGLLGAGLLVALLGAFLLHFLMQRLARLPWPWRQGLRRLGRHPAETLLQLATFTLAFTAVLLVARGGDQLVSDWQAQLPEDRPSQFAIDIQPYEKDAFTAALEARELKHSPLYPILRARLTHINGEAARSQVPEGSEGDNSLRRELNLTWSQTLPQDNRLLQGPWWPEASDLSLPPEVLPISAESGFAERLGLQLGDRLRFDLGGSPLVGEIINLREVNWENFRPNFFVIFPPDRLEDRPHTFLASFALPETDDQGALLRSLSREFPGVAFLDIRALLSQAEGILRQLSLGVYYLLGFVLLAGLVVTWALIMSSLDARQKEQALLKVMGAQRARLARRQGAEFALLGGLSGVLAAVLGELLYSLLAHFVFQLHWSPAPLFWILPPLLGALLLAGFAHLALRASLNEAPHRLLQRLS